MTAIVNDFTKKKRSRENFTLLVHVIRSCEYIYVSIQIILDNNLTLIRHAAVCSMRWQNRFFDFPENFVL